MCVCVCVCEREREREREKRERGVCVMKYIVYEVQSEVIDKSAAAPPPAAGFNFEFDLILRQVRHIKTKIKFETSWNQYFKTVFAVIELP